MMKRKKKEIQMNKRHLLKYIILFLVGYCVYIAIEVTFRNYSFPLMGVVGAISFILIDRINEVMPWDIDLIIQSVIGSLLVTTFELIVGEGLKFFNQPPMWDYSSLPLNFDGVICLQFSLVWVLLSALAIFLADAINYYLLHEDPVPHYNLLGKHFSFPIRRCSQD